MRKPQTSMEFESIIHFWRTMCGDGENDRFINYNHLISNCYWDQEEMEEIVAKVDKAQFRPGKREKRVIKYLIESEVERFNGRVHTKDSATIRFGNFKSEKASDFCIVGGCFSNPGKRFYLYYRSVELRFEFMFDMFMLTDMFKRVNIKPKEMILYFPRAFCSSRERRLVNYHKLRRIIL